MGRPPRDPKKPHRGEDEVKPLSSGAKGNIVRLVGRPIYALLSETSNRGNEMLVEQRDAKRRKTPSARSVGCGPGCNGTWSCWTWELNRLMQRRASRLPSADACRWYGRENRNKEEKTAGQRKKTKRKRSVDLKAMSSETYILSYRYARKEKRNIRGEIVNGRKAHE